MAFKLFLLAAVIAVNLSLSSAAVHELGDADFESRLADMDTALVMFYAPWCGHCKRLKPEYVKAAAELVKNDPPVHLVQVDCTEAGKDTCGKFSVSGYPTVKIFKSGSVHSDYKGPREAAGIVKHMKSQVGPVSKELKSVAEAEAFLAVQEPSVVFFGDEGSVKSKFLQAADLLRESVRFAHVADEEALKKYGFDNQVVLFRAPQMKNKFEDASVKYEDVETSIVNFIKVNIHGMVGHRTQDTAADFKNPLVTVYYNVDYVKNAKGTNYWRNRVLKVAQNYAADFSFAVANNNDFNHELEEFGITYVEGDKPAVCAKDADGMKFVMEQEFSMDNLEAFLKALKAGELEAHVKSEPVPETQGNVKVGVGKNFAELVTNSGRDALVEFYAPWCGHCKKLTPVYEELGDLMANEDVDIVKVDATANDVPPSFNVRGFPTIFWKPAEGSPVSYEGGRDVQDFVKYIAKHASTELKGFSRDGSVKKAEL